MPEEELSPEEEPSPAEEVFVCNSPDEESLVASDVPSLSGEVADPVVGGSGSVSAVAVAAPVELDSSLVEGASFAQEAPAMVKTANQFFKTVRTRKCRSRMCILNLVQGD